MAYTRKTWENGEVITATALNNIEEGISELKTSTAQMSGSIESSELHISTTLGTVDAINGNLTASNKITSGELETGNAAFSGAVSITGTVTVPTPNADSNAATKAYVDGKETSIKAIQLTTNDGLSFTGSLGSSPTLSLGAATSSVLGGVKVGTGLSVAADGTLTPNIPNASTSTAGLMSSAHFDKLEGIAAGATANVGTVIGVKINGEAKEPTNGVVNIGDNIVTGITMNNSALTVTDGEVDLGTVITAHQDISTKANSANPVFTGSITLGNTSINEQQLIALLALLENNGGE